MHQGKIPKGNVSNSNNTITTKIFVSLNVCPLFKNVTRNTYYKINLRVFQKTPRIPSKALQYQSNLNSPFLILFIFSSNILSQHKYLMDFIPSIKSVVKATLLSLYYINFSKKYCINPEIIKFRIIAITIINNP